MNKKRDIVKYNSDIIVGWSRLVLAGCVLHACYINGGILGFDTIWHCVGILAILQMFIATDKIMKGYK